VLILCPETRAMLQAFKQGRDSGRALSDVRSAAPDRAPARPRKPSPEDLEARLRDRSLELSRLSIQFGESLQQRDRVARELEALRTLSDDALVTVDGTATIRSANHAAGRLFGTADLPGRALTTLVTIDDAARLDCLLAESVQSPQRLDGGEFRARHLDGHHFPVQIHVQRVQDEDRFVCSIRDLSEHRMLQRQLVEVAEHEKRQIGQELHDSIGQQLTGLRFYAEMLAQSLAAKSLPEADQAKKLRAILETVGNQVRELSHGLMPTIVDGSGLVRALSELARDIDYLDLFRCEFVCYEPRVTASLTASTATQLYRIAQEATQNAIRHSRGQQIRIALESAGDDVVLRVEDNGVGIAGFTAGPVDGNRQDSGGIRIMQHRAALIGAGLRIETGEGNGTIVHCRLAAESKAESKPESKPESTAESKAKATPDKALRGN
jgi:two-component system, LuxR family, sensor kinase FixL